MSAVNSINRRDFLAGAFFGLTSAFGLSPQKKGLKNEKPNIVLIMADDMGFSDLGCYGGEIHTPNLDDLAEKGLRFSQFYNNAMCAPTRASLLTGLYSQQVGIVTTSAGKYQNCVTLAELLKTAGYRTLMSGKWHADEIPVRRGFDRSFSLCDGACNYFNPGPRRPGEPEPGRKNASDFYQRWAIDDREFKPYAPEDKKFYTTDAFTDYALQYLDQYGDEKKPFFLYLAYNAPHYPLHAWPEDIAQYRGKYMMGWDELRQQRFERIQKMSLFSTPIALPPRDETVPAWDSVADKEAWDLKMAVYAAIIDRMDQNIGRILKKIRRLGKEENTLIMFLSDNGACGADENPTPQIPPGPVESFRTVDRPWAHASNTPFRKFKGSDHEGGVCTPFLVSWPAVIKKGGRVVDQVGHIIDVMPTFSEISGASYPATYGNHEVLHMEGKSLLSILQGYRDRVERTLCWRVIANGFHAVRKGKWKLVTSKDNPWQLYDMEHDRFETHDLAAAYPEKVKELDQLYYQWEEKVGIAGNSGSLSQPK